MSWPTASKFRVTQAVAKDSGSGYWYEARDFSQAEHSGTHTDAPAHFYRDRWHTADIPLNRLAAPAFKVDISQRADSDPDTELLVSDLEDLVVLALEILDDLGTRQARERHCSIV